MSGQLVSIGILIIFIGIIILTIGVVLSAIRQEQTRTEGGLIFFIGPIPILGWATRKEILYALIIISLVLLITILFLRK